MTQVTFWGLQNKYTKQLIKIRNTREEARRDRNSADNKGSVALVRIRGTMTVAR